MATLAEENTHINSSDDTADRNILNETSKQTLSKTISRKDGVSTRSFREGKEKKIGHRRVDDEGQTTYKKIQTSQIMSSIQLGIQNAIGSLASKPERDLLMQDFYVVETISFPDEGTNQTPAHHYSDFVFKVYAPIAFRYFRDLFGIHPDDFLISLCNEPLRELENPGASGSIFYLSNDDELIIKTVQHKEGEFLQKLLPGYYMNLNQNPRTLLPKFFGLFCFQCNSKNIRLVVMNNLLPSTIKIHQKYDLKGSTYKRKANKQERGKKNPTYKDLDFMEHHPEGLLLEAETYSALVKTIQRDCRVLESFKIMDYSLLVGIHNLDQSAKEKKMKMSGSDNSNLNIPTSSDNPGNLSRSKSINRHRLVAHSTAMESIQADAEPIDEDEDVPHSSGGIPARNSKGERLLLFLGIIDILQSYRLIKKLEHTWKSMIHDGDTVSVHRPSFYAQRFQTFMAQRVFRRIPSPLKHSPTKKKSIHRVRPPSLIEEHHSAEGINKDETIQSTQESSGRDGPEESETEGHQVGIKQLSDRIDGVSISQIKIESKSTRSTHSVYSESSSSTSGISSSLRTNTWTPPLSVEGSTPTWTEGTPSYTESSSSGDLACPSTPAKTNISATSQSSDKYYFQHETEVTRL